MSDIKSGKIANEPGCYEFWDDSDCLYIGKSFTVDDRLWEHKTGQSGKQILTDYLAQHGAEVTVRIRYLQFAAGDKEEALKEREAQLIREYQPLFNEHHNR